MKSMYEVEQMLKKEAYLKKVKAHKNAVAAYEAQRLPRLKVVEKAGTIPTAYDTAMARAFAKAGYTK